MESDLLVRTALMAGFSFVDAVTLAKEVIDVFITVRVGKILEKGQEEWAVMVTASKEASKTQNR